MPTPDPIELPELPSNLATLLARVYADGYQAGHDATVEGEFIDLHPNDRDTYWLDHLREHEHVKAYALTPAPQVPDGMVSVPVRLPALAVSEIKDMLASDYRIHDIQARPLWAEFLRIVAGLSIEKQEEINGYRAVAGVASSTPPLNEPFGNPEELPLNEPSGDSGQLASLEQRARGFLQEHSPDFQAGETRIHYFGALRAITAALNEASRAPQ